MKDGGMVSIAQLTQYDLWGNEFNEVMPRKKAKNKVIRNTSRIPTMLPLDKFGEFEVDEKYGMPILNTLGADVTNNMVTFNVALAEKEYDKGVCFYIHDVLFIRVYNNPDKYAEELRRFSFVVGVDFSQYLYMSAEERYHNCLTNRTIEAFWLSKGVKLVHNATWSLPDSYEYSVAGIPRASTIAINSMGISSTTERSLWLRGYRYTLEAIRPSVVLRYGNKIKGEDESISIYVSNHFLKRMHDGR